MDLLPDRCAQPRQRWNVLGMEGSGVAIVITLLCNVPYLSIITKQSRPVGRIASDELQIPDNSQQLPPAIGASFR
jgi:hypothetical protein